MRILVGFMYFSASRAENLIHGRLRPVKLLSGGPCPAATRIFPPGPARPADRATGNQAARNGPRFPHLYTTLHHHQPPHCSLFTFTFSYFVEEVEWRGSIRARAGISYLGSLREKQGSERAPSRILSSSLSTRRHDTEHTCTSIIYLNPIPNFLQFSRKLPVFPLC